MQKTETTKIGDIVTYEAANFYSRDELTVASGSGALAGGTVLGKVTATGQYKPAAVGATDGSEIAKAVLLDTIDASAADVVCRGITRHATLKRSGLIFDATVSTAAEIATKIAELDDAGIKTQKGA